MRFRISSYLQGPPYLHPRGVLSSFLIWAVGHQSWLTWEGLPLPWLLSLSGQVGSAGGVFCASSQSNAGTCTGRPLLEVVPRNQSFVSHSSDHPVLQSPLPVQHTSSLEQLLLQLLWGERCLIRGRPRPATWNQASGDTGP